MQDDAKPVAWLYENEEGSRELILNCNGEYARRLLDLGYAETPLYAHPPAPAQPADVERVALATAQAIYGPKFDGFLEPEEYDFCEKVAQAALAAMPVGGGKRSKPWCDTCGCDVQEVLCPKCAKWWNDNPPADADAGLVERLQHTARDMVGNYDGEHDDWAKLLVEAADRLAALGQGGVR